MNLLPKLTSSEKTKLAKLERDDKKLESQMLTAQRQYSAAARKGNLSKSRLDSMADKAFRYERQAFASADKLAKYISQLKHKHKQ